MIKKAGGDSVTFHVEACGGAVEGDQAARDLGLGVGVAFNPETTVEDAVGASIGADLVLCMSIHPGYSGQRFLPESLERIAALGPAAPEPLRPGGRRVEGGERRLDPASGRGAARRRGQRGLRREDYLAGRTGGS